MDITDWRLQARDISVKAAVNLVWRRLHFYARYLTARQDMTL